MDFTHASVGGNISSGMKTLNENTPLIYKMSVIHFDQMPTRSLSHGFNEWDRGNLYEGTDMEKATFKLNIFENTVNALGVGVDVYMDKLCYIDINTNNSEALSAIAEKCVGEMIKLKNGGKIGVCCTVPLESTENSNNLARMTYNNEVRALCQNNGLYLLDIADIESAGGSVVHNDILALKGEFSSDTGHLNGLGAQTVAKALYSIAAHIVLESSATVTNHCVVKYICEGREIQACLVIRNITLGSPVTVTAPLITGYTLSTHELTFTPDVNGYEFKINYDANKHSVTFNANGGTYRNSLETHVNPEQKYGHTITLPSVVPEKAGFTFDGWFTAVDGEERITGNTIFRTDSDVTYYAHWRVQNVNPGQDPGPGPGPSTGPGPGKPDADGTVTTDKSQGGVKRFEYRNEGKGVTTTADDTGAGIRLNIKIKSELRDGTECLKLTPDQIREMEKQLTRARDATHASNVELTLDLTTGDSGNPSASEVEIPSDIMDKFIELTMPLKINATFAQFELPSEVTKKFANEGKGAMLSLGTVDRDRLNDNQRLKVGDCTVISANLKVGDQHMHQLGGKVKVTLPYQKDPGSTGPVKVWYLDDNNELTEIEAVFDEASGTITFETDHFSYFVIGPASALGSGNSGDIQMIVAVIAIIIAAIIATVVIVRRVRSPNV